MKWKWPEAARRWKGALRKYQYVLLVMAAGVVLLLLPAGGQDRGEEPLAREEGAVFDLDAFERKLERTLSQVEGAGETQVILTLDGPATRSGRGTGAPPTRWSPWGRAPAPRRWCPSRRWPPSSGAPWWSAPAEVTPR